MADDANQKCPLTNLPAVITEHVDDSTGVWFRQILITIGDYSYWYRIVDSAEFAISRHPQKHIVAGMLFNQRFDNKLFLTCDEKVEQELPSYILNIEEIVRSWPYPRRPNEKLDEVLRYVDQNQHCDGYIFPNSVLYKVISFPEVYLKLFLKSSEEACYYLDALIKLGYIENVSDVPADGHRISYKGLQRIIELDQENSESTTCFIAMAFREETAHIRQSIISALESTNYEPRIIDMVHIDSHQTINDAIIAEIRKCQFIIADFTHQRAGVYFEAGFALGLGKKVIYTCQKDDFENIHFDTNHFQHIVYENPDELEKRLVEKIEAWVKV